MKIKVLIITVLLSCAAVAAGAATPRFETILPENTFFCVKIDNMKQFYKKWQHHPLHKLFENPQLLKLVHSPKGLHLEDEEKQNKGDSFSKRFEDEMGVKPERLPELFPGQWVLAMSDFDVKSLMDKHKSMDAADFPLVVLMKYNGDLKTIESMIRSSARYDEKEEGDRHRIIVEKYQGAKLFIEEVDKDKKTTRDAGGYAFIGDVMIMAPSVDRLKEMVLRYKDRPSDSFYTSRRFARARDHIKGSDAYVYLHFGKLVDLIEAAVKKAEAKKKSSQKGKANFSMFSPDQLLGTLNLRALNGFFVGMNMDSGETVLNSGLMLNSRKGIASLFQYRKGKLPQPAYIPDDVVRASVSHFDLSALYTNFENLLMQGVPVLGGMYQGYLSQLKTKSGVDIREGLIANLGNEVTSVTLPIPAAAAPGSDAVTTLNRQLFAIKIKDRQGFEMALEGIKPLLGGADRFEKRNYLGYTIYSFKRAPSAGGKANGAFSFSYTVTDNTFFCCTGSPDVLQKILAMTKKPGKTLWHDPLVRKARKLLPGGNVNFSYTDINQMLRDFIEAARSRQKKSSSKENSIDFDALEKGVDFPYALISQTYMENDGLYNRALLLPEK